jgi:hypothetical protein
MVMSKFKKGDEVYYISKWDGNKRMDGVVIRVNDGKVYAWGEFGWMPEDEVFFVKPQPTGFEVGKWYEHTSYAIGAFQVLFVGKSHALVTRGNGEWAISLKNYGKHREYIPPPPEEWRIVYKDNVGNIRLGVQPFASDVEARASVWWRNCDDAAFKTIRVDA